MWRVDILIWWDRWWAYWQQDVEVDILAERDEDGVALLIRTGARSQVYRLTDAMAAKLAAQLGPVTGLCGQPRIEALQEIVALATAEIARMEREHASTLHADDAGGGDPESH